ncbi:MAG: hypothetical protein R3F55_12185 [Alphaproteobacteria bacterium]
MAIELRRIILEPDEFLVAVRSYLRANHDEFGIVSTIAVSGNRDGSIAARVVRRDGGAERETSVLLSVEHATALLIRFCLENNIPLARSARKKAVPASGSIALQVNLGGPETADFDGRTQALRDLPASAAPVEIEDNSTLI